jgi:hypothetical protein
MSQLTKVVKMMGTAALLWLGACVPALHEHPSTPAAPSVERCLRWQAAQVAWSTVDAYVRALLEQQRLAACTVPPAAPQQPGEVPPRAPTAPPEQQPLPGRRRE